MNLEITDSAHGDFGLLVFTGSRKDKEDAPHGNVAKLGC